MNHLNITYYLPKHIQEGLINGQYERIGGVIRHTNNGQILAHLKETGFNINTSLSSLTNIGSITSILNLGVSAVGFTLVLGKLNQVEAKLNLIQHSLTRIEVKLQEISSKLDQVEKKVDIGYKANLQTGLKLLTTGINNSNPDLIQHALVKLEYSYNVFKQYTETSEADDLAEVELMFEFIKLAILANAAITFCYLEMNYIDEANDALREGYNFLLDNELVEFFEYKNIYTELQTEILENQQELESEISSVKEALSQASNESSQTGLGGLTTALGVGAVVGGLLATGGLGLVAAVAIGGASGAFSGSLVDGESTASVDELESSLEELEELLEYNNLQLESVQNILISFDELSHLPNFYLNMINEIEAFSEIQSELNLSWLEWRKLEPLNSKPQADFIYVFPPKKAA